MTDNLKQFLIALTSSVDGQSILSSMIASLNEIAAEKPDEDVITKFQWSLDLFGTNGAKIMTQLDRLIEPLPYVKKTDIKNSTAYSHMGYLIQQIDPMTSTDIHRLVEDVLAARKIKTLNNRFNFYNTRTIPANYVKLYIGEESHVQIKINRLALTAYNSSGAFKSFWHSGFEIKPFICASSSSINFDNQSVPIEEFLRTSFETSKNMTQSISSIEPNVAYIAARAYSMTDDQIITLDRNTLDAGNVRYLYFGLLDTKDDRSACTIDIEMIRDRYARRDYGIYDMTYDEFNAEWGS